MGLIYLGSHTAFEAFVGSFVVLTTLSYLAALIPFLISGRSSVTRGAFFMPGWVGHAVSGVACSYMVVWIIFYCFPYVLPATADNMNYSSLMAGALTVLIGSWWFAVQGRYNGPPVVA